MWQWGIPVLLQCMAPVLCCSLIWFCPESPRWLVQKGRDEDARKALMRIREPQEVESELQGVSVYFVAVQTCCWFASI
jgi:Sugar (and other) transporter